MEAPRIHLRSTEYRFEHSLDGYKFFTGVGWWVSCAILWGCIVIELSTTDVLEQTLDKTTVPSWIYTFTLIVGFGMQFGWTFFVLLTTGASTARYLLVLTKLSLFIWTSNIIAAFIHFGIAERGVFAFLPMYLLLNTTIWFAFIYYWYVGPKIIDSGR